MYGPEADDQFAGCAGVLLYECTSCGSIVSTVCSMAPLWLLYGSSMAPLWLLYGSSTKMSCSECVVRR